MILKKAFFAVINVIINLLKYNKNINNDKIDLTKINWGKYFSDNKKAIFKIHNI